MARKNNQTLIIVTHDMEIAQYADKIIHITDGDIDQIIERESRGEISV
jgi:putative ABC transport system ATP-binding protein